MESGIRKKKSSVSWLEDVEEDEELTAMSLPAIPQPGTPEEPMEFLARSWNLSSSEISKAISKKQGQLVINKDPNDLPRVLIRQQASCKAISPVNAGKTGAIGRWFHHKESSSNSTIRKKDKARAENARIHSALSVVGLAAALAAVAASENSKHPGSKMRAALASATELLASHYVEVAESVGADRDRVAYAVKSAVDIQTPSELMTLIAAAATALRGESALKARFPKQAKKTATIIPYDKGMTEALWDADPYRKQQDQDFNCIGDLLLHTHKGALRWKHVCIYINKKSQVKITLKSKHVGGAFSKKNKGVVYGVCNEIPAWAARKVRENVEDYFGINTAQGLLEFKCINKIHKQKWVDGIQNLLRQTNCTENTEKNLRILNISTSI